METNREPAARPTGQGEGVGVVAWMGEPGPLLEMAWGLATVFHVHDEQALFHLLRAQVVSGVVLDVPSLAVEIPSLVATIRDQWPHAVILALVDAPPHAPVTTAICRKFDLCISRYTSVEELRASLRLMTLRITRRLAETGAAAASGENYEVLQERVRHLEGLVQTTFTISRANDDEHDILGDLRTAAQVAIDVDDMVVLLTDEHFVDLSDTLFGNAPPGYIEVCRTQLYALPPERRATYVGDEVLLREPPPNADSDSPRAQEAAALGAQSYMRLPLLIDQKLMGFVAFYSRARDRFSGTHLQLGRLFVTQVGATVRNIRLFIRLKQAEQRQAAVSQVARLIAELLELEPVLVRIVHEAVRLINGQSGQLLLRDADGSLIVRAVEGAPPSRVGARHPLTAGQMGRVATSGEPSVIINYPAWEHAIEEMRHTLTSDMVLYGVPLSYRGDVLGVLQVTSEGRPQAEIDEALEVLLMLAPQAATAIANAQLHEQVEQDRRQLRAILDHTTAAVAVCDAKGRLLLMNPALERVLTQVGLAPSTLYGQSVVSVVQGFMPESPPRVAELGGPIEISLGNVGEFVVHIAPIANLEGVIERYVGVGQNVGEIRRADRIRSDMVGVLTHDMGNLVMLARNPVEMLEDPNLRPEQRESLKLTLTTSLIRMEQLVRDMANLDRAEQGRVDATQAYDLAELVRGVMTSNQADAVLKSIALTYHEVHVPSHALRGLEVLVKQAVENLVSNAIKYTPVGGHVDVALDVTNEYALIRVADDGFGIPADKLPYIFDPFYRVKGDRRLVGIPGTGLGLSLVKTIAERHGGRIEVQSEMNVGSVFTLYLPLEERMQSPATDAVIRLDLSRLADS